MPTLERPSWLNNLQAQAAERVLALGLPSVRGGRLQEEWKYTSLGKLDLSQLRVAQGNASYTVDKRTLDDFAGADYVLCFYNGEFLPHASKISTSGEVVVRSLREALSNEKTREVTRFLLERAPNPQLGGIGEINQSQFRDGAFIQIKSAVGVSCKVALVHFYDVASAALVCPRHVICVASGANVELAEVHMGTGGGGVISSATDLILDREARASVAQVVTPSEQMLFFSDLQLKLSQGAEVQFANLSFGGKIIRNEILCDLLEPKASAQLFCAFAATRSQHIDNSSFIRHIKGETKSRQTVKGVASGSARAVFTGRLIIEQDAQKSDASQLNQSLLLSTKAEVDSRPQLEVFADDVKAAHGASVGEISPDEVFYLMSRGVPRTQARHMLGRAYVSAVVDSVDSTFLKNILDRTAQSISEDYFAEEASHE